MIIEFELEDKELVSIWGGVDIVLTYTVKTSGENVLDNSYIVRGKVRGLSDASPYIEWFSVRAITNNEDTLTNESLIDWIN